MKRTATFLFSIIFFIQMAIGQAPDTLLASRYFYQADSLVDAQKYHEGLELAEKAHSIFKEQLGAEHLRVADALLLRGLLFEILSRYKEGADDHQRALEIYEKQLGHDHPRTAKAHNRLGDCLRYISGTNPMYHYQKALAVQEKNPDKLSHDLALTYQSIGIIFFYRSQPDSAIIRLQQSLEILEKEKNKGSGLLGSYQIMGMLLRQMGDYGQSLTYLHKGISICEENPDIYQAELSAIKNDIGTCYFGMGAFEDALLEFKEANHIFKKIQWENTYGHSIVLHHIADTYSKLDQLDSAIYYYQKEIEIKKKIWGPKNFDLMDTYSSIAKCNFLLGNTEAALYYYGMSKRIADRYKQSDVLLELGLAECYGEIGDHERALNHFNSAYDIAENVKGNDGKKNILYLEYMSWILAIRGKFYLQQGVDNNDPEYFKTALNDFEELIGYFDENRNSFRHENSNFALSAKNIPAYIGAIYANFSLYNITKERQYIEAAFKYMEKSKNFSLLKSMHDEQAAQNAGIPNELSKELAEIKNKITFKEQMREKLENADSINVEALQVANDNILQFTQTYNQLLDEMQIKYPSYFQLKYNLQPITLKTAQDSLLGDDHALLEYFVGITSIYALVITKNKEELVRIEKDFPLNKWVTQMRESIFSYFSSGTTGADYERSEKKYTEHAHLLYQHLIAPVAHLLPKKVTIIPDDVLSYIPFDCLLTSEVVEGTSPRDYPYLIRQHQISYAFSASILEVLRGKKRNGKMNGVLAVAPSFGNENNLIASGERRSNIGSLRFNVPEARSVRRMVGGELLLGNGATKQAFLQNANQFQILHLSTHGKASDKFGEQPFIVFADAPDIDEPPYLYASELNWLGLQADLVVLSACESGLGQLKKGEGIISLSRGFLSAGASSTITTLWAVDDESTKTFMEVFYKNLKKGLPKDEALHLAKLHFIEKMPEANAHPFHWAAFTASGDMSPMEFPVVYWKYLLGLAMALIIIFILWKRGIKRK